MNPIHMLKKKSGKKDESTKVATTKMRQVGEGASDVILVYLSGSGVSILGQLPFNLYFC